MKLHLCLDVEGGEEVRTALLGRLTETLQTIAESSDGLSDDVPADVVALVDIIQAVQSAPILPDGMFALVGFTAGPDREMVCDATTLGSNGMFVMEQARKAGAEGDVVRMATVLHFGDRSQMDSPARSYRSRSLEQQRQGLLRFTATCEINEGDNDLPHV